MISSSLKGWRTSQKHSRDENVGHDTKDKIDNMSHSAISGANNFEESVGGWCSTLEFNCQDSE
jgi:hypothetical protein